MCAAEAVKSGQCYRSVITKQLDRRRRTEPEDSVYQVMIHFLRVRKAVPSRL